MIQYFSQKFFFTFHCHGYSPTVKQENLLIIITMQFLYFQHLVLKVKKLQVRSCRIIKSSSRIFVIIVSIRNGR